MDCVHTVCTVSEYTHSSAFTHTLYSSIVHTRSIHVPHRSSLPDMCTPSVSKAQNKREKSAYSPILRACPPRTAPDRPPRYVAS